VEFLEGVARGWTKRDLAAWLSGPYRDAVTRLGPMDELRIPPSEGFDLRPSRLADVMESARLHTLTMLEELALPHGASDFVDEAITARMVTVVEDELETAMWLPVDLPRLRLRDRVRALFVADYLIAPHEYATQFFVCHRCEAPCFDEEAKWMGFCRKHLRPSHTVPKVGVEVPDEEDSSRKIS
jgi:hypothetical protein